WRGSGVACFWATSLEEIIGGVIPIISFRPGGWNSCDSRMTRLPARELPAPYEVAREVLAGRRKLGRDLGPVAFQLLGDELGETGHRALPHLGAGDADDDAVIRLDHDPGRQFRRAVRGANDSGAARKGRAEREAAAERGSAHDEGTTVDLRYVIHGCLPLHALAAAAWIAARTCWKVPQRQILVMLASMSASLGFGLSLSSAATAMIIPHWQ